MSGTSNNGDHERGGLAENKYFKPGVAEQINESAVRTDLQHAVKEEDLDRVAELVAQARIHTYDRELEARGICRHDDRYRYAFENAIMWLYENRPFYAYMFSDIVRRRTFAIDTLCVTIRNARIECWYNPDFMALHTLRENVGFLQHEMGHVAQGHLSLFKREPPTVTRDSVFGLAIDLAVDTLIQSPGDQPAWVLMPKMLRIPDNNLPEDKWESFKERQTWEYYFQLLKQMRDQFPQQFQKQVINIVIGRPQSSMPGGGDGDGQDGDGGEKQEDGGKGQEQGQGPGGDGQQQLLAAIGDRDPLTRDDHRGWLLEDSDNADIQDEIVRQTVRQAYDKAEHSKTQMRGYMSPEMINRIQELIKAKSVPFERIFRAFIGSFLKVGKRHTMVKLSRRRKVPPGHTFERQTRILWAQDDSGSVPPAARALCRSELWHANQDSNVTIFFQRFTYGLAGPLLNLDEVDFKEARKEYDGGTDFQAVCDLADKLGVDLLLIATDGYAPTPRKPRTPVGWILTNDGRDHEWGITIRMPTIEDIEKGRKAVIERWLK